MEGVGRRPRAARVLGVESTDSVLSLLSAFGLAQVAGTALVVDLCGDLRMRGHRTLADIAGDGPALAELSPGRAGVALIASGVLDSAGCALVIEALAPHWPAIVVRCRAGQWDRPTVPVRALLPGFLRSDEESPAVWQPVVAGVRPSGPGPVLPRLSGSLARRMLSGRQAAKARWVRAWSPVWEMPWA